MAVEDIWPHLENVWGVELPLNNKIFQKYFMCGVFLPKGTLRTPRTKKIQKKFFKDQSSVYTR